MPMDAVDEDDQGPERPGGGGNEKPSLVRMQLLVATLQVLLVIIQLWKVVG